MTTSAVRQLVIDGHIHIYPVHDWRVAVRALLKNLAGLADGPAVRAGFLAEAAGCTFFREAASHPERYRDGELALEVGPDAGVLVVRAEGEEPAYLVAGRQIVTAERLEVLAIGADAAIPDGEPVKVVIDRVRSAGAVPVLSWSPGKWFFGRGRVVRQLLESEAADRFLLGDTALRPAGWPFPELMALGRRRGFKVIGGTDPLPLPGEECRLGCYGVRVRAEFDPDAPGESIRRMLFYGNAFFSAVGTRLGPVAFAGKWVANWRRKPAKC